MAKTNAQLIAEIEALKAENVGLKANAIQRGAFLKATATGGLVFRANSRSRHAGLQGKPSQVQAVLTLLLGEDFRNYVTTDDGLKMVELLDHGLAGPLVPETYTNRETGEEVDTGRKRPAGDAVWQAAVAADGASNVVKRAAAKAAGTPWEGDRVEDLLEGRS
jgi:hypothetical protein